MHFRSHYLAGFPDWFMFSDTEMIKKHKKDEKAAEKGVLGFPHALSGLLIFN